jgi:hypothetical protein
MSRYYGIFNSHYPLGFNPFNDVVFCHKVVSRRSLQKERLWIIPVVITIDLLPSQLCRRNFIYLPCLVDASIIIVLLGCEQSAYQDVLILAGMFLLYCHSFLRIPLYSLLQSEQMY